MRPTPALTVGADLFVVGWVAGDPEIGHRGEKPQQNLAPFKLLILLAQE
jgi:hypothetical protein